MSAENNILQALEQRRSYREFTDTPVADEELQVILDAALHAPSSKNAQPWRLHVVRQSELTQEIADLFNDSDALSSRPIDPLTGTIEKQYDATVAESLAVLQNAPVAIFIENTSPFTNGRRNVLQSPYKDQAIHGYNFEMIGIGAAIENMYLATEALGLGGVFMGDFIVKESQIKQKLGMQGDFVGVFALGHPAKKREELWGKPPVSKARKILLH